MQIYEYFFLQVEIQQRSEQRGTVRPGYGCDGKEYFQLSCSAAFG